MKLFHFCNFALKLWGFLKGRRPYWIEVFLVLIDVKINKYLIIELCMFINPDFYPLFALICRFVKFFLALLSRVIFSLSNTKLSSHNLRMMLIFVVYWFDLDFNDSKMLVDVFLSCFWSEHIFTFFVFSHFFTKSTNHLSLFHMYSQNHHNLTN